MHACINEAHSLANLQDLIPTLAGTITRSTNQPKWELNLVDLLESVLHLYMHGCTYPQCLYDQLDS